MKKLKKLAAIAIASVMTIGMMTVNSTPVEAATCSHEWTTKTENTYKTQYRCKGCQKYFASKSAVTSHGKKTSKKNCGTVDKTRKVVASTKKYDVCKKCSIKKSDTKNVQATCSHKWTKTSENTTKQQVQCEGCRQWFDNQDTLIVHSFSSATSNNCGRIGKTRTVTVPQTIEKCTICGKTRQPDTTTDKPSDTKPSQDESNKTDTGKQPSNNETSKPVHTHTWVDHKATKQVPRTVHHNAVYETVTVPAVSKSQIECEGCGQWYDSFDDLTLHAFMDPINENCGAVNPNNNREVIITPAHTEQKLVKDAWDETVYDTQTYVDYQYCSGCGQRK